MRRWRELGLAAVGVWAPVALAAAPGSAANDEFKQEVEQAIEAHAGEYAGLAHEIWEFAEVGYQEERSAASLKQRLRSAGFSIEEGVAGIPTAFVASYGSGSPTIALLAEFDALPGLSQAAGPTRQPLLANPHQLRDLRERGSGRRTVERRRGRGSLLLKGFLPDADQLHDRWKLGGEEWRWNQMLVRLFPDLDQLHHLGQRRGID